MLRGLGWVAGWLKSSKLKNVKIIIQVENDYDVDWLGAQLQIECARNKNVQGWNGLIRDGAIYGIPFRVETKKEGEA